MNDRERIEMSMSELGRNTQCDGSLPTYKGDFSLFDGLQGLLLLPTINFTAWLYLATWKGLLLISEQSVTMRASATKAVTEKA